VTRPPFIRLYEGELVVDNFAGGGGASTGIAAAVGRDPDIAINHDPEALAIYRANHPGTRVLCEDVRDVVPRFVCGGRPVGLLWASPDCTFFSKARGAKPHRDRNRTRRRRGLAGVVLKWAAQVKPRVILMENVEEFKDWSPLVSDGKGGWIPDPSRKGQSFRRWRSRLVNLGYNVEIKELRACDFGAPTSRKRLFIVAHRDGGAVAWPQPTHGPGRALPFRTAAECIDWSIPCPSIFERKKPLAEATLRRIARGIRKYVIEAAQPFIVPLTHQGDSRVTPIDGPLPTVTGANRGEQALVTPLLSPVKTWGGGGNEAAPADRPLRTTTTSKRGEYAIVTPTLIGIDQQGSGDSAAWPVDDPLRTVTTENRHAVVAATLINTRNGEREGQAPRVRDIREPMPTVTAKGSQGALVTAFLAKHYGGPNGQQTPGSQMTLPMGTVTAVDHHALIATSLVKLKGTCKDGQPVTDPLGTVQAQGLHYAEVRARLAPSDCNEPLPEWGEEPEMNVAAVGLDHREQVLAFLITYYGVDQSPQLDMPLATVTTHDRFGLVTIHGVDYAIVDIGMRMLTARELFNAQGFPPGYVIDPVVNGKPLSKTEQVHKCGNSVCPPLAEALVRANFAEPARRRKAVG